MRPLSPVGPPRLGAVAGAEEDGRRGTMPAICGMEKAGTREG
jgi:hypothetical protein